MKQSLIRIGHWIGRHRGEIALIIGLLFVVGLAHAWNMFHYPYYESDEGTYMAQAWSFLTHGTLAPYTYWYDHAPAGWFLIALWIKLTGGVLRFGFSINSGRVLMLVLHLASAVFLYCIAKKLSNNNKAIAVMSVLLFSLSPLAIYFQRRVLLDNIMVFWLLLSILLLLYYRRRLRFVFLSAVTFGIAVLSKETAIFFLPVLVYILYTEAHIGHRSFAVFAWVGSTCAIISLYVLYALINGELFPAGSVLGGSNPHVSLLATLEYQAGRSGGGILGTGGGSFYRNFIIWYREDPLIMITGVIGTVGSLILGIKQYGARIVGLLALSMWLFLVRGGLVIEFYIIPLIPFIALAFAYVAGDVTAKLQRSSYAFIRPFRLIPYALIVSAMVMMVTIYAEQSRGKYSIYTSDQTSPQVAAVQWLLSRSRPDQFYAIDMYSYIDTHIDNKNDTYKHAEYYWKVDDDPDIKTKILHDDYHNIDYLMQTPQMRSDYPGLPLMSKASQYSLPVVSFSKDGWSVDALATRQPHQVLSSSWYSYKEHFLQGGKTIEPQAQNRTTAQAQASTLLRAVWMNDRTAFQQTYVWTITHLKNSLGTINQLWQPDSANAVMPHSASDSDTDTALSLLFAANQWRSSNYSHDAQAFISALWNNDVTTINGRPYMMAGNWANTNDYITVNPSYLSPAAYRIFSQVDTQHDWLGVVATSYDVLTKCTTANLGLTTSANLPPDWCRILKSSESAAPSLDPSSIGSEYSFDALRTSWRVALDVSWFKSPEAQSYLASLNFLDTTYKNTGHLDVAYTHTGAVWENYESVTGYGGAMGYFIVEDPAIASTIYAHNMLAKYYENATQAYWEDPQNLYAQNWAWLGSALYNKSLPNLAANTANYQ